MAICDAVGDLPSDSYFLLKLSNVIPNSVDPDQTLLSVASDLGLHCLPMSLLWDARHK